VLFGQLGNHEAVLERLDVGLLLVGVKPGVTDTLRHNRVLFNLFI